MAKILLIEDDQRMASMVADWLSLESHVVDVVNNGLDGFEWLSLASYEVAIVDWQLPGMTGVDVCSAYRAQGGLASILILTGKTQAKEKMTAFDAGADDYLTKPFEFEELSARVQALLRRPRTNREDVLKVGDIELNTANCLVFRSGKPIRLNRKELRILEFLMRHPNHTFSADEIVRHVWSLGEEPKPEVIRAYIQQIRSKLGNTAKTSLIKNVPGIGYRLELDARVKAS